MGDFLSTVTVMTVIIGALSTSIPVPDPHQNVYICPQQPVAESIICRSAQWLRWRVVFEDSLALSDITREYISSDPVGHTHEATGNGLSFSFNLTFNNQSQLVSIMTVTRQIITNSTINIMVHCGQDTHQLSWITAQDPPVPASPVITNESIVGGDSRGIAITLEWTSRVSDASESVVDSYIINVSPPIGSVSTFTTANTSIQLFILYNQDYNISVVATNCVRNSTPTETNVKIGYCIPPITVESNMTMTPNKSGLVIIYYCRQSGNNPSVEPIAAVCARNGNWSTNLNELECLVYLESYVSTNSRTNISDITESLSTIDSEGKGLLNVAIPTFTISMIVVLAFGIIVGFLLAKCCLKKHPKLQSDVNTRKESETIDLSIPIYEQVIKSHIIMDQNPMELTNNVAYGPIQPKIN